MKKSNRRKLLSHDGRLESLFHLRIHLLFDAFMQSFFLTTIKQFAEKQNNKFDKVYDGEKVKNKKKIK